ncbi:MAG: enoyl-CoA hydratase/isomerase family protein [Acidobacteria bacterium]|nr:enoyl-CoA hydratase/isomerase family protein [Acidobacteriota bacterium]
MAGLVHCEVADGVATITLDSPANRNALSRQLVADLNSALDRAEQEHARAVVLTHTPPVFCAGADLKERAADTATPPDGTSAGNPMATAMQRLATMPAVTIAAVDGPARAGGIGLMAACDLVVVNPQITFALTEVRIGVAPAIISVPILARCGWSKLASAWLTGEPFGAETARDMGLVTHVSDDVAGTVRSLVQGVLAGAPGAVAAAKAVLRQPTPSMDDRAVMAEMTALSDRLFRSEEAAEGMRAFAEKRPPRWATGGPA